MRHKRVTCSSRLITSTSVCLTGNGRVDLRELTEALYKLQPNAPLSAARDSALDIFLLFDKDRNDQYAPWFAKCMSFT